MGVQVDTSRTPDLVPTIAVELSKMSADIPGAAGRARASAGGKLHGAGGHGQERGIVMALTVAGLVAGGTRVERSEAVDVSYPGFIQLMAGGEG